MKAVLISIQPKWCELIASGIKTVEVRKSKPKIETPFKVYIYETNWKDNSYYKVFHKESIGKVIGEFVCDNIAKGTSQLGSCLSMQEISKYSNGKEVFGWHISNLIIYDKPKELSEFYTKTCVSFSDGFCKAPEFECGFQHCIYQGDIEPCVKRLKRPPQSWCYVEELKEGATND